MKDLLCFLLANKKLHSIITCLYIQPSCFESLFQCQVKSCKNHCKLKLFSFKEPAPWYGNKFVIDVSHRLQVCTHARSFIVHFIIYTFHILYAMNINVI